MRDQADIYVAPVLPGGVRGKDSATRSGGRRVSMEIPRHNWEVGPDHDVIVCAPEGTGHRIGHTCAGCGARVSLGYIDFTFAGSSDNFADADVVAGPLVRTG